MTKTFEDCKQMAESIDGRIYMHDTPKTLTLVFVDWLDNEVSFKKVYKEKTEYSFDEAFQWIYTHHVKDYASVLLDYHAKHIDKVLAKIEDGTFTLEDGLNWMHRIGYDLADRERAEADGYW